MNRYILFALVVIWFSAVAASLVVLEEYTNTPGSPSVAAMTWPRDTELLRASDKPTALFFAHPKCPCTQASLQEFQRIEARYPDRFHAMVVFTVPDTPDDRWTDTRLIHQAENLKYGAIVFDKGGREAVQFHCSVSGQVLLFNPDGRLIFAGGITPARGHEGNNGGQEAFEYALTHPDTEKLTFPVFGCSLIRKGSTALDSASEDGS